MLLMIFATTLLCSANAQSDTPQPQENAPVLHVPAECPKISGRFQRSEDGSDAQLVVRYDEKGQLVFAGDFNFTVDGQPQKQLDGGTLIAACHKNAIEVNGRDGKGKPLNALIKPGNQGLSISVNHGGQSLPLSYKPTTSSVY